MCLISRFYMFNRNASCMPMKTSYIDQDKAKMEEQRMCVINELAYTEAKSRSCLCTQFVNIKSEWVLVGLAYNEPFGITLNYFKCIRDQKECIEEVEELCDVSSCKTDSSTDEQEHS